MTQARNMITVVEVTSVLNATGGTPLVTRFASRPFTDRSAGWVAVATLLQEPTLQLERAQGRAIRGESVPSSSPVTAGLPISVRTALAGRNCERQALRWWRVARSVETLSGIDPSFVGLASGWDISDSEIVIQAFSSEKLFDAPVQQNKFKGRGPELFFTEAGGQVLIAEPTTGDWDVTDSLTVEVGFTRDTLLSANPLPLISRGELNGADDEFAIYVDGFDAKLEAHYKPTGASAIDLTSSLVTVSGTRYHAALQWDGVNVQLGWDGAWDVSSATAIAPFNGGAGISLGALVEGVSNYFYGGAIDFCRVWIDDVPTWAEMTAWANRPVPSGRQSGIVLELLLNEGQWVITEDPARSILSEPLSGSVEWRSSKTGDPELRGKRWPWCLGYVPSAPATLIDKVFQLYRVSSAIETGIPRSGGRRLQERLEWSSLTLTFDTASRTIKDHRSGNTEWSDLLAGAVVRTTGSASNDDTDYILARDAYQVGNFYFVELLQAPVSEASVVVTKFETVIGTTAVVSATGTVDFDGSAMTITAQSGQSFAEFLRGEKLTVTGSTDNDGVDAFTVYAAPYLSSGKWVIPVAPGPTDGIGDTGVTIEQVDTRGEYTLDPTEGQFTLPFTPTKSMTFEAYGEPSGGATPRTAAEQMQYLLDNGSTAIQAIPYSAGRLATMARKFPALSGIAQGPSEVLTFEQALRVLKNSMGAHYWISPRTGNFEILDWPFVPRNPVPIDQAFLASDGATGSAVDLQDDPDSGKATVAGVVLTNPAAISWVRVEVDQIERPYVESFLVRIAAKGSKSTVTMDIAAFEGAVLKKVLGTAEVGTAEVVSEFTLTTSDLTDDSGGNTLAISIQNSETDGSSLTVGAVELVPTWKVTEIGPEDTYELNPDPSVPGAGAVEVHYSLNKVRLSAGDIALPVLANRSAEGREALERVSSDFLVDSYPETIDGDSDLAVLETSLVEGDDAQELAETAFAGAGTNTWFELRVSSALLASFDPFFRFVRFSSAWQGILSSVTDDVDVVAVDEGELETRLAVVLVGRVL